MQLIMIESSSDTVRAGYECACGCKPTASYERGGDVSTHVCCCGNEFAVGADAQRHVAGKDGFHLETVDIDAPWGESIQAAWMIGASTHPEPTSGESGHAHQHEHGNEHGGDATEAGAVIDPVCGMTVEPPTALEKGLHSHYKETDYFFCGKGCKLDFDEDPERYLDPTHVPSM